MEFGLNTFLLFIWLWNDPSWLFGLRLCSEKIFQPSQSPLFCCFCMEFKNKAACFLGLPLSLPFLGSGPSFFPCLQILVGSYMFLHCLQRPSRGIVSPLSLSCSILLLVPGVFPSVESCPRRKQAVSWACKGCLAPALTGALPAGPHMNPLLGEDKTSLSFSQHF